MVGEEWLDTFAQKSLWACSLGANHEGRFGRYDLPVTSVNKENISLQLLSPQHKQKINPGV